MIHMPPTSDVRFRLSSWLEEANIEGFAAGGNLIGAIRDGGVLDVLYGEPFLNSLLTHWCELA